MEAINKGICTQLSELSKEKEALDLKLTETTRRHNAQVNVILDYRNATDVARIS